ATIFGPPGGPQERCKSRAIARHRCCKTLSADACLNSPISHRTSAVNCNNIHLDTIAAEKFHSASEVCPNFCAEHVGSLRRQSTVCRCSGECRQRSTRKPTNTISSATGINPNQKPQR